MDHEPGPHLVAPVGGDRPTAAASSSHRSAVTAVWKHASVVEAEVAADACAVLEDLGAEGVLLLRHVADLLEQRQVDVRLDVALRARVAVPVPGAAEVAAVLDDAEVRRRRPSVRRAPASRPPKPPPMMTTSISSSSGSRSIGDVGVRVLEELGVLGRDLDVLVVAVGAQALVPLAGGTSPAVRQDRSSARALPCRQPCRSPLRHRTSPGPNVPGGIVAGLRDSRRERIGRGGHGTDRPGPLDTLRLQPGAVWGRRHRATAAPVTTGGTLMETIAKTASGVVRGTELGTGVVGFRGLPYAAPPVGALRFRPPQRPAAWDGIREADRFGAVVPQTRSPGVFDELFGPTHPAGADCLNLNVWTPDPGAAGLPVLVWIHGGAFVIGSGSRLALRRRRVRPRRRRDRHRQLPPRRRRLPPHRRQPTAPAPSASSTRSPRSSGCRRTSPRSAATRAASPSPASRPAA